MLSPGDRVKDYEVIAPLRSGGMAMLYLARRRGVGGFSRLVALKLVHPHLLEDESINRLFLEEARIAANIAHPNVVNVEEVGQSGDSYFIAMEYVHGVSLAELLESLVERRLRMSPKLCVWLAAQVAEALHAAHEATGENGAPLHIVHRDISPQNVLIAHTGHIKLIDFGIADSQHTTDNDATGRAVLGKLGYMAPEQLRMQVADRRSDVYALGVTLWEMLTSRNLFRCQRIDDDRDWATRESPPPPSKHSPIAMPALDRVVLKAIACAPGARYESALAFRSALLRAAPAAAQVDAPMFAALMRSMLGEELERRRASWPSDVSVELNLDDQEASRPALSLGELTADMGASGENRTILEEEDPTTLAEAPAALRSVRTAAARAPLGSEAAPSSALELGATCAVPTGVTSREAHIDTLSVPASDARPPGAGRTARALSLAALCLVLGIVLGSLATSSQSGGALGVTLRTPARAAPAAPPVARAASAAPAPALSAQAETPAKPTFTVLSALTLHPTGAGAKPPETPSAEKPAPETPSAEKPAPETPSAEKPAPETPSAEKPAPETPAAQAPAVKLRAAAKREGSAHVAKRGTPGRRNGARPGRAAKLGLAVRKTKNVARPRVAPSTTPW